MSQFYLRPRRSCVECIWSRHDWDLSLPTPQTCEQYYEELWMCRVVPQWITKLICLLCTFKYIFQCGKQQRQNKQKDRQKERKIKDHPHPTPPKKKERKKKTNNNKDAVKAEEGKLRNPNCSFTDLFIDENGYSQTDLPKWREREKENSGRSRRKPGNRNNTIK